MAHQVTDALIMQIAYAADAFEGVQWSEDMVTSWRPYDGGFVGWVEEKHVGESLYGEEVSASENVEVWVGFDRGVLTYKCACDGCSPAENVQSVWQDNKWVERRVHHLCPHAVAVAMVVANTGVEWPEPPGLGKRIHPA